LLPQEISNSEITAGYNSLSVRTFMAHSPGGESMARLSYAIAGNPAQHS
jgi:hypothetical protein